MGGLRRWAFSESHLGRLRGLARAFRRGDVVKGARVTVAAVEGSRADLRGAEMTLWPGSVRRNRIPKTGDCKGC